MILKDPCRRWTLAGLFALGLALTAVPARAQMLDSLDRAMLDSALALIRLEPAELGFDKLWAEDDTFRLAVVERLLAEPLATADYVDESAAMVDSFARRPYDMLQFIDRQLAVDPNYRQDWKPVALPEYDPQDPFKVWKFALDKAEPLRRKFYAKLDSLELHDLIMAAPAMWSEAGDSANRLIQGSWQREFGLPVDTSREVNVDRLLDIIKKLDVHALLEAASIVAPAAQMTAKGVASQGVSAARAGQIPVGVSGDVVFFEESLWGGMIIGGDGFNVYTNSYAAIIDLGGDDVYKGRQGGAMGELGSPYALLIDLSGDDYYDSKGVMVSHGAGFLGIGILIDHGGEDTYRSAAYSQGAGFFGVGFLADHGGSDDRRGDYFVQGAGHCGAGVLLDDGEGNDRALAAAWAQGFAGTFGYGLYYDQSGSDNYRAGGVHLHEPLLPHDYKSFSGGFGMGWRPRAGGGIGFLYDDGDGNDFYDAEVMAFGSSYWYSIGMLVDGGGNDYYSLAHYGLGVGIHLSVGALYDRGGDDQYRSRFGVVGGTPHDLSVGLMVDGSGDDMYMVGDGWGGSLTNSVGVFIDRLGDDLYATRGTGTSLGNVRWARGFAGAAIFLDLEGDDVYPQGELAADSTIWMQGGWGVGMDLPRHIPDIKRDADVGEIVLTAEDSLRDLEELYKDAVQWEVGNARESVRRARETLKARGVDALRYAFDEGLDTRDGLVYRLLEELSKNLPDSAAPLLMDRIETSKAPEEFRLRANAASILGEIKWKPAVPPLLRLLDRRDADRERNSVIAALGKIGDPAAAKPIRAYITDDSERRRITTITALQDLKDMDAIPLLVGRLDDPAFTVRSAAGGALVGFKADAIDAVVGYGNSANAKYPDLAARVLARLAETYKDSLSGEAGRVRFILNQRLLELLDSPDEFVRAAAVEGLYKSGGDASKALIVGRMEAEYSPVVKAAYERAKR